MNNKFFESISIPSPFDTWLFISLGIFILVNSLLNSSNKKLIKSFESFALIPSNKGFFALITLLNSSGA